MKPEIANWMKWTLAAHALALLWWINFATGWLPRPSKDEAAAIEALSSEQASVSGERNAFAALYSFNRDVPEAQWETVAMADLAEFSASPVGDSSDQVIDMLENSAYPPYPKVTSDNPALCPAWSADCLDRVRGHMSQTKRELARAKSWIERGEKLTAFDHYRNLVPPRPDAPIPLPVGRYADLMLAAAALDHIEGRSDAGLNRLCSSARSWRRLRDNTDFLLVDMVAVALLSGAATLYAEILAELPADVEPPCAEVFAPLADRELDQCAVFASEFRLLRGSLSAQGGIKPQDLDGSRGPIAVAVGGSLKLSLRRESNLRVPAHRFGRFCMPEHQQRAKARSAEPLPKIPGCARWQWFLDPLACHFARAIDADYDKFYIRLVDLDGRLRLVEAALALRGQSDVSAAQSFAARPASQRSGAHAFSINADAGVLSMRPHEKAKGDKWKIRYRSAVR